MAEKYEKEVVGARILARCSPGPAASLAFAEAVVDGKEHTISLSNIAGKNYIMVSFYNEFGPTVEIDDIVERMIMPDWKEACKQVMRLLLTPIRMDKAGLYEIAICPTVSFTPEAHTSIINRVDLRFAVPKKTYDALVKGVAYREHKV